MNELLFHVCALWSHEHIMVTCSGSGTCAELYTPSLSPHTVLPSPEPWIEGVSGQCSHCPRWTEMRLSLGACTHLPAPPPIHPVESEVKAQESDAVSF